jgi:hypothetical protein
MYRLEDVHEVHFQSANKREGRSADSIFIQLLFGLNPDIFIPIYNPRKVRSRQSPKEANAILRYLIILYWIY